MKHEIDSAVIKPGDSFVSKYREELNKLMVIDVECHDEYQAFKNHHKLFSKQTMVEYLTEIFETINKCTVATTDIRALMHDDL